MSISLLTGLSLCTAPCFFLFIDDSCPSLYICSSPHLWLVVLFPSFQPWSSVVPCTCPLSFVPSFAPSLPPWSLVGCPVLRVSAEHLLADGSFSVSESENWPSWQKGPLDFDSRKPPSFSHNKGRQQGLRDSAGTGWGQEQSANRDNPPTGTMGINSLTIQVTG